VYNIGPKFYRKDEDGSMFNPKEGKEDFIDRMAQEYKKTLVVTTVDVGPTRSVSTVGCLHKYTEPEDCPVCYEKIGWFKVELDEALDKYPVDYSHDYASINRLIWYVYDLEDEHTVAADSAIGQRITLRRGTTLRKMRQAGISLSIEQAMQDSNLWPLVVEAWCNA
jgi:hypothetical protein